MKQIYFKKTKYSIKSLNDDYSIHFKPISKYEVISMLHNIPQQGVQCLFVQVIFLCRIYCSLLFSTFECKHKCFLDK